MNLLGIYSRLLGTFGPQGWWPTKNRFSPPEWEVCVGAVLTQSTNWKNAEKALDNLEKERVLSPADVAGAKDGALEEAIRPSGFYRQKAERLRALAGFVMSFGGFGGFSEEVTRPQLLDVKGLGPETVDSILLYAIGRPVFVIDAYTRRVFTRTGFCADGDYEGWRRLFESGLPEDAGIYREFHALIVELAKKFCRKEPLCAGCPLMSGCESAHPRGSPAPASMRSSPDGEPPRQPGGGARPART